MPITRSGYASVTGRTATGRQHRRARAQTLAEETTCAICGEPATDNDPLVAGHIIPHAYGGPTARSNYRAMHATCNNRLGSLPFNADL